MHRHFGQKKRTDQVKNSFWVLVSAYGLWSRSLSNAYHPCPRWGTGHLSIICGKNTVVPSVLDRRLKLGVVHLLHDFLSISCFNVLPKLFRWQLSKDHLSSSGTRKEKAKILFFGFNESSLQNPGPELKASVLNKLWFHWMDYLMWRGYKTPITQGVLWDLPLRNRSRTIIRDWDNIWDQEIEKILK